LGPLPGKEGKGRGDAGEKGEMTEIGRLMGKETKIGRGRERKRRKEKA